LGGCSPVVTLPSDSIQPSLPPSLEPIPPEITPEFKTASYISEEVPFPRLQLYVHAISSYYYIAVPPELAAEVEDAIMADNPFPYRDLDSSILGYPSHSNKLVLLNGYYSLSDTYMRNLTGSIYGEMALSNTEATQVVKKLFDLASEVMGWRFDVNISHFTDIASIDVVFDGSVYATISEQSKLKAFEDFMANSIVPKTASNTQGQVIELHCTLEDGTVIYLVADPWDHHLWIPPSSYYFYSGEATRLLDILGLDSWPDGVLTPNEFPYTQAFCDELYSRVGAAPPQ
jgi:hypothetical protein